MYSHCPYELLISKLLTLRLNPGQLSGLILQTFSLLLPTATRPSYGILIRKALRSQPKQDRPIARPKRSFSIIFPFAVILQKKKKNTFFPPPLRPPLSPFHPKFPFRTFDKAWVPRGSMKHQVISRLVLRINPSRADRNNLRLSRKNRVYIYMCISQRYFERREREREKRMFLSREK